MNFNKIITRETSKIKMRIRCDFNHRSINQKVKMINMDDPPQSFRGHVFEKSQGHLILAENFGYGKIISPFEMVIKLKSPLKKYIGQKYGDGPEFLEVIQGEIDKVFRKDARKAAMIIDQKSFDDTPERYMFGPLLYSEELCRYYGVSPIIKYGNSFDWMKDISVDTKWTVYVKFYDIMVDYSFINFYCKNHDGTVIIHGDSEFEPETGYKYTNSYSSLHLGFKDVSHLDHWGLCGKPDQSIKNP